MKLIGTIEKKPFTIVKAEVNNEEKYFIACGKMKTNKLYDTLEDAEKEVENRSWELICLLIEQFTNFLKSK